MSGKAYHILRVVLAVSCFSVCATAHAALDLSAEGERQLIIADNDYNGPGGSDIQSLIPLLASKKI